MRSGSDSSFVHAGIRGNGLDEGGVRPEADVCESGEEPFKRKPGIQFCRTFPLGSTSERGYDAKCKRIMEEPSMM